MAVHRPHLGAAGLHLRGLRHFSASGLIAAGSDVVTVQRALVHRSPSTTLDPYSHLWPSAEDHTRAGAATLTDWSSALPRTHRGPTSPVTTLTNALRESGALSQNCPGVVTLAGRR